MQRRDFLTRAAILSGAVLLNPSLFLGQAMATPLYTTAPKILRNGLLQPDKPDLFALYGVPELKNYQRSSVTGYATSWPDVDEAPSQGWCDDFAAKMVTDGVPDGTVISLDHEVWPNTPSAVGGAGQAARLATAHKFALWAQRLRNSCPTLKLGFYAYFHKADYFRALELLPSIAEWQANNEDMAEGWAEIDIAFPSMYFSYNRNILHGVTAAATKNAVAWVRANMEECRRCVRAYCTNPARGVTPGFVPVCPYVWWIKHDTYDEKFMITNITKANPAVVTFDNVRTISGISKANPGVITYVPGATDIDPLIYNIVDIADVVGMTEVNGQAYGVGTVAGDTWQMKTPNSAFSSVNTSAFTTYVSGGTATIRPPKERAIVLIRAISAGMTQIDNAIYQIRNVTANTFELYNLNGTPVDTSGGGYSAYTIGGTADTLALLDWDVWRDLLYYCYLYGDGFVLWGGSLETWHEVAPWWNTVKRELVAAHPWGDRRLIQPRLPRITP